MRARLSQNPHSYSINNQINSNDTHKIEKILKSINFVAPENMCRPGFVLFDSTPGNSILEDKVGKGRSGTAQKGNYNSN